MSSILTHFKKNRFIISSFKQVFNVLALLPKKKNLVVFESFNGRQYSDNPRAIYEFLKRERPDLHMYWSADKRHLQSFSGEKAVYLPRFSLKWLFVMTRAKYWVTNSRFPLWMPKSKRTVYVQTWHGTPLKKLGVDIEEVKMPGTTTEKYRRNFAFEASKWDYLISPNDYSTNVFRRAFQYNGTVIESGYPRNDFLFHGNNPDTIREIKKNAGLPEDKKIILYAPTWRDNEYHSKGKYRFTMPFDLQKLQETLGDEYVIIFRLHYLVSENLDLGGYENFAYDLSSHTDIRELYLISDMLVTDYSSVFFDYSILDRPILFFAYDIESYRDELRGFYFDIEQEAPGPIVKTTDQLLSSIQEASGKRLSEMNHTDDFQERFSYLEDGDATKRVVDEVFTTN